jgi:putative ABC transport system permease protein
LGYDKDGLIFLRVNGNADVISGFETFKNELLTNSLVSGVATANSLPVGGLGSGGSETVNNNGEPLQVNTARLRVDQDFLKVYGIKLIAGKDFLKTSMNDSIRPIIINEMAVKKFGWQNAEAAIGKPFRMGERKGIITAVVEDFHFNSLQEMIEPLAIYPRAENFSRITIRADVSKAGQTVTWINDTWKKHFPSALFDYNFMDNQVGEQYQAEERFSKLFSYFSILSLLIACLGLYGLITYSTSQRTKEIGVRKVLGASVSGIAFMLSKSFLKLVVLAFLIAAPIGWFVMNKWLQDFAYRTNISWWMFALAGSVVVLIALLTVSFRAIKSAIANPVKSLRTE